MSGNKGIYKFPESDNIFKWIGIIHGAAGTFLASCYHSNMHTQGDIYLDILEDKCLLGEPNTDNPLNTQETYSKQVSSQES
ncbi:unnamed protein product [Nyctereutes procyonoides]|uniref:(raccoon dog) hypothetical protein n=1 Tax=Nyctereutes procyonoides TaxID=34880 RepID=A0A811YFA4_NYCPR|nr:unnamed protein product [Nyctereutes procyonoides]